MFPSTYSFFEGHDELLEDVRNDFEARSKPLAETSVTQADFTNPEDNQLFLPVMTNCRQRWNHIRPSVLRALGDLAHTVVGDEAMQVLKKFNFRPMEAFETQPKPRSSESLSAKASQSRLFKAHQSQYTAESATLRNPRPSEARITTRKNYPQHLNPSHPTDHLRSRSESDLAGLFTDGRPATYNGVLRKHGFMYDEEPGRGHIIHAHPRFGDVSVMGNDWYHTNSSGEQKSSGSDPLSLDRHLTNYSSDFDESILAVCEARAAKGDCAGCGADKRTTSVGRDGLCKDCRDDAEREYSKQNLGTTETLNQGGDQAPFDAVESLIDSYQQTGLVVIRDAILGETRQIGTNTFGGWWFNHATKKLHDVSSDASGGTNDHVGFVWATGDKIGKHTDYSNGQKLGLAPHHVDALKRGYGFHHEEDHPDFATPDWDEDASEAAKELLRKNTRVTSYSRRGGNPSIGIDTLGSHREGINKAQDAIIHLKNAGHEFHPDSTVHWEHTTPDDTQSFHKQTTLRDLMSVSHPRELPESLDETGHIRETTVHTAPKEFGYKYYGPHDKGGSWYRNGYHEIVVNGGRWTHQGPGGVRGTGNGVDTLASHLERVHPGVVREAVNRATGVTELHVDQLIRDLSSGSNHNDKHKVLAHHGYQKDDGGFWYQPGRMAILQSEVDEEPSAHSLDRRLFKSSGGGTSYFAESAPPGFEGTVRAMKTDASIKNPYALAWSMKNKGYKSHRKADGSPKNESEDLPSKYGFKMDAHPNDHFTGSGSEADEAWKHDENWDTSWHHPSTPDHLVYTDENGNWAHFHKGNLAQQGDDRHDFSHILKKIASGSYTEDCGKTKRHHDGRTYDNVEDSAEEMITRHMETYRKPTESISPGYLIPTPVSNNSGRPSGEHGQFAAFPVDAPQASLALQGLHRWLGLALPELHALTTSTITDERQALSMLFNELHTAHCDIGNVLSYTGSIPDTQMHQLSQHYAMVVGEMLAALDPYRMNNPAVTPMGPYRLSGQLNDSAEVVGRRPEDSRPHKYTTDQIFQHAQKHMGITKYETIQGDSNRTVRNQIVQHMRGMGVAPWPKNESSINHVTGNDFSGGVDMPGHEHCPNCGRQAVTLGSCKNCGSKDVGSVPPPGADVEAARAHSKAVTADGYSITDLAGDHGFRSTGTAPGGRHQYQRPSTKHTIEFDKGSHDWTLIKAKQGLGQFTFDRKQGVGLDALHTAHGGRPEDFVDNSGYKPRFESDPVEAMITEHLREVDDTPRHVKIQNLRDHPNTEPALRNVAARMADRHKPSPMGHSEMPHSDYTARYDPPHSSGPRTYGMEPSALRNVRVNHPGHPYHGEQGSVVRQQGNALAVEFAKRPGKVEYFDHSQLERA